VQRLDEVAEKVIVDYDDGTTVVVGHSFVS
jgi:hypothetical protein